MNTDKRRSWLGNYWPFGLLILFAVLCLVTATAQNIGGVGGGAAGGVGGPGGGGSGGAATNAIALVDGRGTNTTFVSMVEGVVTLKRADGSATNFFGTTALTKGTALTNANHAASAGDIILANVSSALLSRSLGKNGVNWNFAPGNTVIATNVPVWADGGSEMTFKVAGGNFYSTNAPTIFITAGANTNTSFDVESLNAYGVSQPVLRFEGSGKIFVKAQRGWSQDYDVLWNVNDGTIEFDIYQVHAGDNPFEISGNGTIRGRVVDIYGFHGVLTENENAPFATIQVSCDSIEVTEANVLNPGSLPWSTNSYFFARKVVSPDVAEPTFFGTNFWTGNLLTSTRLRSLGTNVMAGAQVSGAITGATVQVTSLLSVNSTNQNAPSSGTDATLAQHHPRWGQILTLSNQLAGISGGGGSEGGNIRWVEQTNYVTPLGDGGGINTQTVTNTTGYDLLVMATIEGSCDGNDTFSIYNSGYRINFLQGNLGFSTNTIVSVPFLVTNGGVFWLTNHVDGSLANLVAGDWPAWRQQPLLNLDQINANVLRVKQLLQDDYVIPLAAAPTDYLLNPTNGSRQYIFSANTNAIGTLQDFPLGASISLTVNALTSSAPCVLTLNSTPFSNFANIYVVTQGTYRRFNLTMVLSSNSAMTNLEVTGGVTYR
jgi:hypothetical protein